MESRGSRKNASSGKSSRTKQYIHFFLILFNLQSLEWRKQWDVDNVKEWDPPEPLKTYHPSGVCGYDKDGAPGRNISFFLFIRDFLLSTFFDNMQLQIYKSFLNK